MRLIDADALMARFQREQETMYEHGREYSFSFLNSGQEISTEWYAVERFLEEAPTIEERKTGKWEHPNRCSECGFGVLLNPYMHNLDTGEYTLLYKFCPNCGADMRGDENE